MLRLVGLSGKKRHGKNSVYMLAKMLLDEDETGRVIRMGFADALKEEARTAGWNGVKDEAGRRLLQTMGVSRREQDPEYWVRKLRSRIVEEVLKGYRSELIFITDVRFPNEASMLRGLGAELWRVVRPDLKSEDTHVSETALDDYRLWDQVLVASDLGTLLERTKVALRDMGFSVA